MRYPESGSMCHALAVARASAPHSSKPWTEPMVFGLGGGIGVGYFVFEYADLTTLYLNTRTMTQETKAPGFHVQFCDRAGVRPTFIQSSKCSAAESKLGKALDAGHTPIVWVSRSGLSYYAARGMDTSYHTVTVLGTTNGGYRVQDRPNQALEISADELFACAMNEYSPKFRALILEPSDDHPDVRASCAEAISKTREQMLHGWSIGRSQSNTGVNGLEKWADLLTHQKDKKGWRQLFPQGKSLFDRLVSVVEQIELRGERGALRNVYADFLEEAAVTTGDTTLSKHAKPFRESAAKWTKLAETLLPDAVEPLGHTHTILHKKDEVFLAKGDTALPALRAFNEELDTHHSAAAELLRPELALEAVLERASACILEIAEVERAAFTALPE